MPTPRAERRFVHFVVDTWSKRCYTVARRRSGFLSNIAIKSIKVNVGAGR